MLLTRICGLRFRRLHRCRQCRRGLLGRRRYRHRCRPHRSSLLRLAGLAASSVRSTAALSGRSRSPPRAQAKGRGSRGHSSISCQDCLTCQNCSGCSFFKKKVLRDPNHKISLKDAHVLKKGKCNYVYKFQPEGEALISANTHNLLSFSIIQLDHLSD